MDNLTITIEQSQNGNYVIVMSREGKEIFGTTAIAKSMSKEELMNQATMDHIVYLVTKYYGEEFRKSAILDFDKARIQSLQVHDLLDDETFDYVVELIKLYDDEDYQSEAYSLYETAQEAKVNKLIKQVLNGNFAAAGYVVNHPELATSAKFNSAIEEFIHQNPSAVKASKLQKLDEDTARVIQAVFGIKW